MMKAIVCTKYGAPDVLRLQEVEKPVPKDNEVLIKIHAAAATAAGLIGRKGEPFFVRLFSGLTKPQKNILVHDGINKGPVKRPRPYPCKSI